MGSARLCGRDAECAPVSAAGLGSGFGCGLGAARVPRVAGGSASIRDTGDSGGGAERRLGCSMGRQDRSENCWGLAE